MTNFSVYSMPMGGCPTCGYCPTCGSRRPVWPQVTYTNTPTYTGTTTNIQGWESSSDLAKGPDAA